MPVYFTDLPIGRLFHINGNDWIKQSPRTARMLSNGRVFFFRKNEVVHQIAH